jgi:hypothetical protein
MTGPETRTPSSAPEFDAIIVGAGFAGLYMLYRAREVVGLKVRLFEAGASMSLYMKADSWYVGANIPGKKRVFMPYVGGNVEYRRLCNESAENGYAGFELQD